MLITNTTRVQLPFYYQDPEIQPVMSDENDPATLAQLDDVSVPRHIAKLSPEHSEVVADIVDEPALLSNDGISTNDIPAQGDVVQDLQDPISFASAELVTDEVIVEMTEEGQYDDATLQQSVQQRNSEEANASPVVPSEVQTGGSRFFVEIVYASDLQDKPSEYAIETEGPPFEAVVPSAELAEPARESELSSSLPINQGDGQSNFVLYESEGAIHTAGIDDQVLVSVNEDSVAGILPTPQPAEESPISEMQAVDTQMLNVSNVQPDLVAVDEGSSTHETAEFINIVEEPSPGFVVDVEASDAAPVNVAEEAIAVVVAPTIVDSEEEPSRVEEVIVTNITTVNDFEEGSTLAEDSVALGPEAEVAQPLVADVAPVEDAIPAVTELEVGSFLVENELVAADADMPAAVEFEEGPTLVEETIVVFDDSASTVAKPETEPPLAAVEDDVIIIDHKADPSPPMEIFLGNVNAPAVMGLPDEPPLSEDVVVDGYISAPAVVHLEEEPPCTEEAAIAENECVDEVEPSEVTTTTIIVSENISEVVNTGGAAMVSSEPDHDAGRAVPEVELANPSDKTRTLNNPVTAVDEGGVDLVVTDDVEVTETVAPEIPFESSNVGIVVPESDVVIDESPAIVEPVFTNVNVSNVDELEGVSSHLEENELAQPEVASHPDEPVIEPEPHVAESVMAEVTATPEIIDAQPTSEGELPEASPTIAKSIATNEVSTSTTEVIVGLSGVAALASVLGASDHASENTVSPTPQVEQENLLAEAQPPEVPQALGGGNEVGLVVADATEGHEVTEIITEMAVPAADSIAGEGHEAENGGEDGIKEMIMEQVAVVDVPIVAEVEGEPLQLQDEELVDQSLPEAKPSEAYVLDFNSRVVEISAIPLSSDAEAVEAQLDAEAPMVVIPTQEVTLEVTEPLEVGGESSVVGHEKSDHEVPVRTVDELVETEVELSYAEAPVVQDLPTGTEAVLPPTIETGADLISAAAESQPLGLDLASAAAVNSVEDQALRPEATIPGPITDSSVTVENLVTVLGVPSTICEIPGAVLETELPVEPEVSSSAPESESRAAEASVADGAPPVQIDVSLLFSFVIIDPGLILFKDKVGSLVKEVDEPSAVAEDDVCYLTDLTCLISLVVQTSLEHLDQGPPRVIVTPDPDSQLQHSFSSSLQQSLVGSEPVVDVLIAEAEQPSPPTVVPETNLEVITTEVLDVVTPTAVVATAISIHQVRACS